MKIALCLIVKPDDAEADVLYRALSTDALYKKFDGVFITITGENEKVEAQAKQIPNAHISHFKWVDDFAKARNFNFSQVPKDYDWIMWIDADDIVKGSKWIRKIAEQTDPRVSGIVFFYLYDFDEYGECTVKHNKIRLIKNDGSYKWVGELHEDLMPNRKTVCLHNKQVQVLHLTNHKRVNIAIQRNLKITEKALKKKPNDPRSYFNYANALHQSGRFMESIKAFFDFIPMSSSEEEQFLAWNRIAYTYFKMRDLERSVEAALEALRIRPWYPDAYFTLAQSFFDLRKFKHAKEFLVTGLTKDTPEFTSIVWNPRDYDYNPMSLLAKTYIQLADYKRAYKILNKMVDMFPKDKKVKSFRDEIYKVVLEMDKVDEICEAAKDCKNKLALKALFAKIPKHLRSHPKLCHLKNVHFVKTKSSGKDLAIYCFETMKRWDGNSKDVTGSEEAVINIAPLLADLGWNVTEYNSCGYKAKKIGKVWWRPFWEFNPRDKWDVLIAWRHPLLFDHGQELGAVARYVWLHDVLEQTEFPNHRVKNIDKIIPLSQWHRDLFPAIPDNKFMISANGINQKYFEKKVKRNPYKLVWSSSPDRGLHCLLNLYPEIKKQVPELTLDIFYGWGTFDSIYKDDAEQQKWKQDIMNKIQELEPLGVKYHGMVDHETMAEEYMKSSIWAYPTEFTEISCITAMKCQLAGAVPITTDVAALKETVQFGRKLHCSNIYSNKKAQKKFVKYVVDALKDQAWLERTRKKMIPWAKKFNWDTVAYQWSNEFKNALQSKRNTK